MKGLLGFVFRSLEYGPNEDSKTDLIIILKKVLENSVGHGMPLIRSLSSGR